MAAQALYRKYRSQTFEEVIGQEHVTTTLRNAIREGRIAHAYLFSGPRGTGKTSTARILAKAVNCLHPDPEQRPDNTCPICTAINEGSLVDLVEMDAASHTSVEHVRELIEKVHFAPTQARYKVYVIDEAHMLSNAAFNALLKTLEEPPPHVIFILATTEPHKIPETVRSRCQRFDFRRIPASLIVQHLRHILEQEGYEAEPAALEQIALVAEGCMRDAVSLLDQLLSYGGRQITLEQVEAVLGVVPAETLARMGMHLVKRETGPLLQEFHRLVAHGVELRQFLDQWMRYLRDVLLISAGGEKGKDVLSDLPAERVRVMEEQARIASTEYLLRALRQLNAVHREVRNGVDVQIALELALVEITREEPTPPISAKPHSAPVSQPTSRQAPTPPAPVPAGDEEALAILKKHWKGKVTEWFREHRRFKIQAALNSAEPVRVANGRVDIMFQHRFAKEKVENGENLQLVARVISKLLGREYQVRCFVKGEPLPGPGDLEDEPSTPPTNRMSEVLKDPLVKEAVQQGGQVVDIR